MLLLGIDFETNGPDPETPGFSVTEVGCALWSVEHRSMLESFSVLHKTSMIPLDIVGLTEITPEMTGYGNTGDGMPERFWILLDMADAVVAHYHFFEKSILEKYYRLDLNHNDTFTWIDTMTDILYPSWMKARNLVQLAALHGVMNPHPHRALNDVFVMFDILAQYNFKDTWAVATTPFVKVVAQVSYADRNLAKDRRFYWDSENKIWHKTIRKFLLDQESKEYEFPIEISAVND